MQRLVLALIVGVALPRVAATYGVFCQTADEPVHIAAGYEWLTSNHYDVDRSHPPLARAASAVWPLLTGATADELLFHGGHYLRNLAGCRAPNLIFFLIAMVVVFLWSRSIVAVALFSLLPPVLAHAGLAT